jgi:hypothetical protein
MIFGDYTLHFEFQEQALLPPFKGSTIRGAFGWALRRVVCALKTTRCDDCILRDRCVYATVFEAPAERDGGGPPSPPHPFVIEPPLSTQTEFSPGDELTFKLLLFGWANERLPYMVYAFEQLGENGFGRRFEGRRATSVLKYVTSGDDFLYESLDGTLVRGAPRELNLEPRDQSAPPVTRVTVKLETPLRIKHKNWLQAELPFHVLARGAMRRIAALNTYYGAGEPPLDYKGLAARAMNVKAANSRLRWLDIRRYSNRQAGEMYLGGMTGEITYEGGLGEFLPLLRYCEKVHLGKATTFGLGKIAVTAEGT